MTFDDVAEFALALAEVTEGARHGHRTWFVGGRAFAWERPFTKADLKGFGHASPPEGSILAVMVASLEAKDLSLTANPTAFFTIPHFHGYPAVLIQLPSVGRRVLRDALADAWRAAAPPALRNRHAADPWLSSSRQMLPTAMAEPE